MLISGDSFNKVNAEDELPAKNGKYIVFTKTAHGNGNVFGCSFTRNGKKTTWGCSNQIVTHWLKQIK
tara:strand:+ start:319 stop:519 length:201 start_codon:yes stop_codon:yes gene_type:complete